MDIEQKLDWLKIQAEMHPDEDVPSEMDYKFEVSNGEINVRTKFGTFPLVDIISNKYDGKFLDYRFDQRDHRDGCCSCTLSGQLIAVGNYVGNAFGTEKIGDSIKYGIDNGKPEGKGRQTSSGVHIINKWYNTTISNSVMHGYSNLILGDKLHPAVEYAFSKGIMVRLSYRVSLEMYREAYATNKITKSQYGNIVGGHSSNLKYENGKYYIFGSSLSEDAELVGGEKQIVELVKSGLIRNMTYITFSLEDDNNMTKQKEIFKEARQFMIDNDISNGDEPQRYITRGELFVIAYRIIKYIVKLFNK